MNIKDLLKNRPLSWSSLSSFDYNPEEWFKRYILGEPTKPTAEMVFGKKIGTLLEKDPTFLPQVPRLSKMEHPFNVVFNGIPLVGYADSFCTETNRKLKEFKTGKKAWDQKRVDSHGQIDMYLFMHFITTKIPPEEVHVELVWMPTQENGDFSISFVPDIEKNIKIFQTKRTMGQILQFGARINKTVEAMQEYVDKHIHLLN